tara:strand:- start:506 stop:844 length:339 start_codon:yes stop_codon:yes gene_type:complete
VIRAYAERERTVRASLCAEGVEIYTPTPIRTLSRAVVPTVDFIEAMRPRQATHLEAVIAVASLLDPETIDRALALVLDTCDDAAEAYASEETADRSDALTFLASAVRGEVLP